MAFDSNNQYEMVAFIIVSPCTIFSQNIIQKKIHWIERKIGHKIHVHCTMSISPFSSSKSGASYWVVYVPILHNSIYFQYRFQFHVTCFFLTHIHIHSRSSVVPNRFSFFFLIPQSACKSESWVDCMEMCICSMLTYHLILVLCALCPDNVAKKFYKYASVQILNNTDTDLAVFVHN